MLQHTLAEYTHSSTQSVSSSDPLDFLSVIDEQQFRRHKPATRRSAQSGAVAVPLRRCTRVEHRWRAQAEGPYAQVQGRRLSLGTVCERRSLPRRTSLKDSRRGSYENEAVLPAQKHPPRRFRRQSLQPHVLNRMVPVEDMDPFEGFQPFTELESRQQREPVLVPKPVRDLQKPRFEYVWKPSVDFPKVGGMRVRVGQFERIGQDTMTSTSSCDGDGNKSYFSDSGSEGYFTAQDWSSSSSSTRDLRPSNHGGPDIDAFPPHIASSPHPYRPQPEFIQGSSKSALALQQQTLVSGPSDTYTPFPEHEFPQCEALARHYSAVHNEGNSVFPLQPILPPGHAAENPSISTLPSPMQRLAFARPLSAMQQFPQFEQSYASTKPPRMATMPCTLPGTAISDYSSESTPSLPSRVTGLAVDPSVDWATREPWEYIHRVLTSSTCPLVLFIRTPTEGIPAAALGARGAELHTQTVLIDKERWLLVGSRDIDLDRFRVGFQARAHTPDRFTLRLGNLAWGADVSQIEDEVVRAAIERAMRGRDVPATLPAMFIAGTMGGLAVWYALSLM
ncbi:hypothetical protein BGW80DRAFT_1455868 [Lactifluus volemus]|nr:hypothetical protein BGW80DRAFT_1455868 [Lactifluus volemus]